MNGESWVADGSSDKEKSLRYCRGEALSTLDTRELKQQPAGAQREAFVNMTQVTSSRLSEKHNIH